MRPTRRLLFPLAGVVAVVALVVATSQQGAGVTGPKAGSPLPTFAAPLVLSGVQADANISSEACSVKAAGAVTSCSLVSRGPAVIGFLTADDSDCRPLAGSLEGLARAMPGVSVAAVGIRGDRGALAALAAKSPSVKVLWDRDGALADRYGIAVCPTVVVVERGGRVAGSLIGDRADGPGMLEAGVTHLLAAGR